MTGRGNNRQARVDEAVRWLGCHEAFMAAGIMRLGTLVETTAVPTAAVKVVGDRVRLLFNPEFLDSLRIGELAGILIHEAFHVIFAHPKRVLHIRSDVDRHLYLLACEAVINDIIHAFFSKAILPGDPVTGTMLVGADVHERCVEDVFEMLCTAFLSGRLLLAGCHAEGGLDDHGIWLTDEASDDGTHVARNWDEDSDGLVRTVVSRARSDDLYGSSKLGAPRMAKACRPPRSLEEYLKESLSRPLRLAMEWTRPNAKAIAVYPQIVLPRYECTPPRVNILLAIDASGSISNDFLSISLAIARQPLASARVTLISFDTEAYEVDESGPVLRGGGGTDAEAVERYIHEQLPTYPEQVFVFTDGFFKRPWLAHPERWIWILPPSGVASAIPYGGHVQRFALEEIAPQRCV